jgi:hypothetical protein
MNCLDYAGQQNYSQAFDALLSNMSGIVSSFSVLLQSSINDGTAEYVIVRNQNGQNNLYFIDFVLDSDGVWRLESM